MGVFFINFASRRQTKWSRNGFFSMFKTLHEITREYIGLSECFIPERLNDIDSRPCDRPQRLQSPASLNKGVIKIQSSAYGRSSSLVWPRGTSFLLDQIRLTPTHSRSLRQLKIYFVFEIVSLTTHTAQAVYLSRNGAPLIF